MGRLTKTVFAAYARCMPMASSSLNQLVTALVPSLSRSLAEPFNVFRVMHHGTHEKQLSNVFAWLLRVDGTHELVDAFQRLFVEQVNRHLPAASELPSSGYRVLQEVDTSGRAALGSPGSRGTRVNLEPLCGTHQLGKSLIDPRRIGSHRGTTRTGRLHPA